MRAVPQKRKVGAETLESPVAPERAVQNRDSLVRAMYSTAFDWLLTKINLSLRLKVRALRTATDGHARCC